MWNFGLEVEKVEAGYFYLVGKFIIYTELKLATPLDVQKAFLYNF